jgi:hypothetical protein
MKAIQEQSFNRSRNAEQYQYHSDVLKIVTLAMATKYNFSELYNAYVAAFAIEDEAFIKNRTLEETKVLEESDRVRDNDFIYVRQTIDSNLLCPLESKRIAAEKLAFAIKPYRMANVLPYAENTAQITSFTDEMQSADFSEYVAALGLTDIIAQLKQDNEAFNITYNARSSEKLDRRATDNMKLARPRVDATFREISSVINALYLVNSLTAKSAETEAELGSIIDRINALSLQLQQTINVREGRKTAATAQKA